MAWRKPTNLREWLRIIFRHRKKFFFPCVAAMIIVVLASKYVPREYRAEAMFERRNDSLAQAHTVGSNRLIDPLKITTVQDLTGRSAIEQLVEDLQLTRNLPHNPDGTLTAQGNLLKSDLVKSIQSKLRVSFQTRSDQIDRITVSFTDSDRVLAPKVVNRIVSNYIDSTRAELNAKLVQAKTFFEREVGRFSGKVQDLEARKLRFELDNPGLLPDDPASLQIRLSELRAKSDTLEQALQVAIAKRNKLDELVKTMPENLEEQQMGMNPERQQIELQRAELERALDDHIHRWGRTEAHPAVQRTRKLIEELNKKLEGMQTEVATGRRLLPNPQRAEAILARDSLSGEIVALERQRDEVRNQIEQAEVQNRNFFVIRNEYQRILRELDEAQSQLRFWDTNLRNTSLTLQQEVAQHGWRMSFINRAPDLARPSSPTFLGILAAALVAGVAVGVAMIVLAELLDHSFRSVEQAVDELKLPVLGTVNEIISPAEAFRRKVLNLGVYPSVAGILILVLTGAFFLAWLSLDDPQKYEELRKQPVNYVKEMILG